MIAGIRTLFLAGQSSCTHMGFIASSRICSNMPSGRDAWIKNQAQQSRALCVTIRCGSSFGRSGIRFPNRLSCCLYQAEASPAAQRLHRQGFRRQGAPRQQPLRPDGWSHSTLSLLTALRHRIRAVPLHESKSDWSRAGSSLTSLHSSSVLLRRDSLYLASIEKRPDRRL